jgi:hypothetical protein
MMETLRSRDFQVDESNTDLLNLNWYRVFVNIVCLHTNALLGHGTYLIDSLNQNYVKATQFKQMGLDMHVLLYFKWRALHVHVY